MRARDIPAPARLMARIADPNPAICWPWMGVIDANGYGRVGYKGRRGTPAHQAFYDCFIGPIPPGITIDHACHTHDVTCAGGRTCRHRRCVNPGHLQPVTAVENTAHGRSFSATNAAKTHCPEGHGYAPDNTYRSAGRRYCIACYVDLHGCPPIRTAVAR